MMIRPDGEGSIVELWCDRLRWGESRAGELTSVSSVSKFEVESSIGVDAMDHGMQRAIERFLRISFKSFLGQGLESSWMRARCTQHAWRAPRGSSSLSSSSIESNRAVVSKHSIM